MKYYMLTWYEPYPKKQRDIWEYDDNTGWKKIHGFMAVAKLTFDPEFNGWNTSWMYKILTKEELFLEML